MVQSKTQDGIFLLPHTMNSSTTSNCLKVVNRVHTIYSLRLPHYTVLASLGISLRSMRNITVILDTSSGSYFVPCSSLILGWLHHAFLYNRIPPVGSANGNPVQILSAVILRIQFGNVVETSIFLVADYFSPWKYSLKLDSWIAKSILLIVMIDEWGLLKARYLFLEAPQMSLQ